VFCFPLIKSKSPAGIIPSVLRYILFVFVIIYMSSCNIYSFTGASISPDIKTVSITNFSNNALIVNPLLSSILTEKLRDRFITTSNLSPVQKNGDLSFEGTIITYNTAPIAIQANETASQNRLTVVVSVKFVNKKDEKQNYESSFSRFADYQSGLPFSSVEDELSRKVSEQLVDDIFNKAVVNW
jgi:hypothetical protein